MVINVTLSLKELSGQLI